LKLTNVDASLVIEPDRARPLVLAERILAYIRDNPGCGFNASARRRVQPHDAQQDPESLVTESQVRNEGNGKRGRRHAYVAAAPDPSAIRIVRSRPNLRRAE